MTILSGLPGEDDGSHGAGPAERLFRFRSGKGDLGANVPGPGGHQADEFRPGRARFFPKCSYPHMQEIRQDPC